MEDFTSSTRILVAPSGIKTMSLYPTVSDGASTTPETVVQVDPSPPHIRHLSSCAWDPIIRSQPTVWRKERLSRAAESLWRVRESEESRKKLKNREKIEVWGIDRIKQKCFGFLTRIKCFKNQEWQRWVYKFTNTQTITQFN